MQKIVFQLNKILQKYIFLLENHLTLQIKILEKKHKDIIT